MIPAAIEKEAAARGLELSSEVSFDGAEVTFVVKRDGEEVARFDADYVEAAAIERQIRHANAQLHANAIMRHATAVKTVGELLERAIPAEGVGVKVDPGTGAVTLMLMFSYHPPMAVVVERGVVLEMVDDIEKQTRRKAH